MNQQLNRMLTIQPSGHFLGPLNTLLHFWGSCSFSGPPGPPEAVTIDEITDTTAQLSWRPGPDNHSPITMYVIQARTPFSVGWQAVNTGTVLNLWFCCLPGAPGTQQNGHSCVAEAEGPLVSCSDTSLQMRLLGSVSQTSAHYTIIYLIFFFLLIHICLFFNLF